MVAIRSELKIAFDYESVSFDSKATRGLIASGTELRRFAYLFEQRRPYDASANSADIAMTI